MRSSLRRARRRRGGGARARAAARGSPAGDPGRARRRSSPRRPAARASTTPQGSTIIERPPERCPPGCSPTWLAAITKTSFSIARARTRISQWSRVVGQREGGRQHDDARAARRERAEQLGEAQVVADRQAQLDAVGGRAQHDLLAGLGDGGLAVGASLDLDVEHVQLAVGRAQLARRVRRARRCSPAARVLARRSTIDPATQVDPQLARQLARPRDRGPVERLGAGAQVLVAPEHGPLLREYDQSCAVGGRGARQAIRGGHVRGLVGGGVELDCRDLQSAFPPVSDPFPE